MNKSISVVIPAFNAEDYIVEALESVAGQSRKPDQVVVVDDGSTDGTYEVVESWSHGKKLNLHLLHQENRGLPGARNAGIRHATTDLVALLDADDVFLPHHLNLLCKAFERDGIVLCFGDGELFDSTGVIKKSLVAGTLADGIDYDELPDGLRIFRASPYMSLLPGNYIPVGGTMFVKKAAESIGLYDESLRITEDRDFNLRLSRIGPFAYYPLIVHRKRSHDNNITHPRNTERNMRYQLMVLQKMLSSSEILHLNCEELKKTLETMDEHLWEMLYAASRKGLKSYLDTSALVIKSGRAGRLLNIKHCLRAIRFSFRAAKSDF